MTQMMSPKQKIMRCLDKQCAAHGREMGWASNGP